MPRKRKEFGLDAKKWTKELEKKRNEDVDKNKGTLTVLCVTDLAPFLS